VPLCRFQLHATGSEIVRLGWVDLAHERVFELSETLAYLLGLDSESRLRRLGELRRSAVATFPLRSIVLRAPVDEQEVWAAGVTYERSRDVRMEESKQEDLYERAYQAARPDIFIKAAGWRCVGDGQPVGIRADSTLDVPEPELTVVIDSRGEIAGYTIGNDLSSRSIEGENALYLSQAKIYHASCALGPWIMLAEELPDISDLDISMLVDRSGDVVWQDSISTTQMHRKIEDLVGYLYRALTFPSGALLMTGTGLVPPAGFTLQSGDRITIEIAGIGKITNQALRLESR
jgi:2-dehydro-3-deoxy-D-arabinonate dehydratase